MEINDEMMNQLAEYNPVPRSHKECLELIAIAEEVFGNEKRLSSNRDMFAARIARLMSDFPNAALGAIATYSEVAYQLGMGDTVFSLAYATASLEARTPSTIGGGLAAYLQSKSTASKDHRDVCRLLLSYLYLIGDDDLDSEIAAFLGGPISYEAFDALSERIPTEVFFNLFFRWFKSGQRNPSRLMSDLVSDYQRARRTGKDWWDQPHVVSRTAMLAAVYLNSHEEDVVQLAKSVPIALHLAPHGPCQYLAALILWIIASPEPKSREQFEIQIDTIKPGTMIALEQADANERHSDWLLPTHAIPILILCMIQFKRNAIGGSLQQSRVLFEPKHARFKSHWLPTMFAMIPGLKTGWYIQFLQWSRYESLRCIQMDKDGLPAIEMPLAELFGVEHILSLAPDKLSDVVVRTTTANPCPEILDASIWLVLLLQGLDRGTLRSADEREDSLCALTIAESFLETSNLSDCDLMCQLYEARSYIDSLQAGCQILLVLSRANLRHGNLFRSQIFLHFCLERSIERDFWGSTWFSLLKTYIEAGHQNLVRSRLMSLLERTDWLSEETCGAFEVRMDLAAVVIRELYCTHPKQVQDLIERLSMELESYFAEKSNETDRKYILDMTANARHIIPPALSSLKIESIFGMEQVRIKALVSDIAFCNRILIDGRINWRPGSLDPKSERPVLLVNESLGGSSEVESGDAGSSVFLKNLPAKPDGFDVDLGKAVEVSTDSNSTEPASSCLDRQPIFDEEGIASRIPSSTMVIKIGFSLSGKLVWSMYRTHGGKLELISHDRDLGKENAASMLRKRIEEFDSRCDSVFQWDRIRTKCKSDIVELQSDLASPEDIMLLGEQYERLIEEIKRESDSKELGDSVLQMVAERFGSAKDWRRKIKTPPTSGEWEAYWSAETAHAELDRATRDMLKAISEILPTSAIAKHLSPQDDVELMVEDILFALPLGFLLLEEAFLFEKCRSMRVVLSPVALSEFDELESTPVASGKFDQVLCMSGLPGNQQGEADIVRKLFTEHEQIAKSNGLIWRGAWKRPRGCHDSMAKGIYETMEEGGRTALLTLIAHGHTDGCVALRPANETSLIEYWTGRFVGLSKGIGDVNSIVEARRSCDLSSVELLLQVSCSIGRPSQRNYTDLRGFLPNLVIAGSRSTVAARWPVRAEESVHLANNLARHYLRRRSKASEEKKSLKEACTRGQSLRDTRIEWLKQYNEAIQKGARPAIGLHTAAAFELYGLG